MTDKLQEIMQYFSATIDTEIKKNINAYRTIENYKYLLFGYNVALLENDIISQSDYNNNTTEINKYIDEKTAEHKKRNGILAK